MKYLWELLNGFAPNSHGRRVWFLARMSLRVQVKGQGHEGEKWYFSAYSAACMRIMFGKTSLAFSITFNFFSTVLSNWLGRTLFK